MLEIKNLSKVFDLDNPDKKPAVDNVSFTVNKGEFLSILGPSGCGKTTLIRMIIGLEKPTTGSILKNGLDITNMPSSERGMGFVFQNYALFENMTVLQNVEYALKIKKETKKNSRDTALSMIKEVGLLNYVDVKPYRLSGGQQQRVAIARTLALKPDIILFDEPMSALDASTRLSLRKEIKQIQSTFNTSIIYITHDQEEAFSMSDKILVMDESVSVQIGSPEEIILKPVNQYIQEFVVDNLKYKIESLSKFYRFEK